MSVLGLLNTTFQVGRPTRATDSQGGFATTYPVVATFPGRLSSPSGRDVEMGARLDGRVSAAGYCAGSANVRRDDRLLVAGRVFRVLAVLDPSLPLSHRKTLLEEVQTGA